MQKIVCTYTKELMPIAVEMCTHLAATFSKVLETDEGSDEKAITAMGLLNTIETLLTVMEEQPDIMNLLEPIVLQVVGHIFQQGNIGKLYHYINFTIIQSKIWNFNFFFKSVPKLAFSC